MTQSELFHHAIIDKFVRTQFNKEGKLLSNRVLTIQPTTYSDKTKFINYEIASQLTGYTGTLDLLSCSMRDLENEMKYTIGNFYKDIYKSVLADYQTMSGIELINPITKEIIPDSIIALHDWLLQFSSEEGSIVNGRKLTPEERFTNFANNFGITVYKDTHYRIINGKLTINELLYDYATNLYSNNEVLNERLYQEKISFINTLLQTRTGFTIDDQVKTILGEQCKYSSSNSIEWISGNKLILAKVNGNNVVYGSEIDPTEIKTFEMNPLLERYFMVTTLVGNNLRLSLTGSEINHKIKALEKGTFNKNFISEINLNKDLKEFIEQ